jgi:hypothetical protein
VISKSRRLEPRRRGRGVAVSTGSGDDMTSPFLIKRGARSPGSATISHIIAAHSPPYLITLSLLHRRLTKYMTYLLHDAPPPWSSPVNICTLYVASVLPHPKYLRAAPSTRSHAASVPIYTSYLRIGAVVQSLILVLTYPCSPASF